MAREDTPRSTSYGPGVPYWDIAVQSFVGYARYLGREITEPKPTSYFYLLLAASAALLIWEQLRPWRRDQPRIRRDFWLDGFYMFFNFFLFSLIGYNAVADVAVAAFRDGLARAGIESLVVVDVRALPAFAQLALMFVLRDFVQYWIHRLLHRVPVLWRFHQVHHSVRQMGFAAHLRFHPAETVVYRTLEYLPLAMIGFGIDQFFVVHAVAVLIGHWNHGNVVVPLGPLRYVLNNPQMHIWHHVADLPVRYGLNYGISLSCWDYLFGTALVPSDGRDIELGFPGVEEYPDGFLGQLVEPLRRSPGRPDPGV